MKKLLLTLAFAGLAIGCGGDTPLDVDSPDFALAGNSGCATVKFDAVGWPVTPDFTVWDTEFTGDLEGTGTQTFTEPPTPAGVQFHNSGVGLWNVSGGLLGALTFETEFDNHIIMTDRPGSPSTVNETMGRQRATSGVRKANLTYKGIFSATDLKVYQAYQGVICP
jgi:hypothetical protein